MEMNVRAIYLVAIIALLFLLQILIIEAQSPVYLGDVNCDNVIDEKDLTKLQNYLLKKEKFSRQEKLRADMNQDGEITVLDLLKLSKYIHYIGE